MALATVRRGEARAVGGKACAARPMVWSSGGRIHGFWACSDGQADIQSKWSATSRRPTVTRV
jgi:hypothetical protein